MPPLTTHHLYPSFPLDLPTASLVSISLRDLQSPSSSISQSSKLFEAGRTLGFFYLDLTGSELGESILREVEELHLLQQEFYSLPHTVKDDYGQDKVDRFFSYRWTQCPDGVEDMWGRQGRREMYNLRADDILGIRPPLPRHGMITSAEPSLASFALHCREIVCLILQTLEVHLSLPPGTLLALHQDNLPRGDFISLQHRPSEPSDEPMVKKGEHTDFGSITMLFNWLGGLQIREQSQNFGSLGDWLYVKPMPGSCVINLADSLVKLTAGILKSNVHRVAPAPGPQSGLPRYSLAYFAHPNDSVELKPVRGGLVDAVTSSENEESDECITAADWVVRRSLGDLRGVYTYKGGIEWRDNNDAVAVSNHVQVKA